MDCFQCRKGKRASREVQVASSGSPTTLFIPESAFPLRNRIGCQRKLEVTYIDTEQTLQISTPLEERPLCVNFVFFCEACLKREVSYVTGSATCLLYYIPSQ